MAVTVSADGLSIVHKGSGGEANATLPDVCFTTVENEVVPIPYGNFAKSADLADGSETVTVDGGNSIAVKACSRHPTLNTSQRGFTLIELVIVVIVLGVLSATALPRFLNLADDADIAVVEGTAGALKGAVNLAHSKWIIIGSPADFDARNDLPWYGAGAGGQIDLNTAGWPVQSFSGSDTELQVDNVADCTSLWNTILNTGSDEIDESATSEPYVVEYINNGICHYRWSKNTDLYIRYDSNTGDVSVNAEVAGKCQGIPEIDISKQYKPGNEVSYQGNVYRAERWTDTGRTPDTQYSGWVLVGPCA